MKATCTPESWSQSFMYSLHQAHFLMHKKLSESLTTEKAISFSQFLILLALDCTPSASQRELAQFLYITEATASRHIDTLEKSKLLERKDHPESRREYILLITDRGKKELQKATNIINEKLDDLTGVIPKAEQDSITKNLHKLIQKAQQN